MNADQLGNTRWWWQSKDWTITEITPGFGTVTVHFTDRAGQRRKLVTPERYADREGIEAAIAAVLATEPPKVATP